MRFAIVPTITNNEFNTQPHSILFSFLSYIKIIDKKIYYLDDSLEPRRISDDKTWVQYIREVDP